MAIPVLATGWVVGAIYHAAADDADLDRLAQAAVNVGTVTFTPATGYHLASTTQAITHGTIVALLDSHGDLHPQRTSSDTTGTDTEDGISLPVGAYDVTYALNHGSLPSHQIVVTAAHTTGAPLALFATMATPAEPGATYVTLAIPAGGTPGQTLILAPDGLSVTYLDSTDSAVMSDAEILTALEGAS